MNKFNLNEKVIVKSFKNQPGLIRGYKIWNKSDGTFCVDYDVVIEQDNWYIDDCLPVAEYLGKKRIGVNVREEQLTPWKDCGNAMDALMYMVRSIREGAILNRPQPEGFSVPPKVCYHSWKTYQGLTQNYDYCEKCDQKKEKL